MIKKHMNRIILTVLLSIFGLFCFAGKEAVSYYQRLNRITANNFSLQENKYLSPNFVYSGLGKNSLIKNSFAKISLRIFDTIPNSISNLSSLAVNQTVYFKITGYNYLGTSIGTFIQSLNVSNLYTAPNSLADSKDIDIYILNGAHKVDVQLVTASGVPLTAIDISAFKMNLAFEIEIETERYYQFDRTILLNSNINGHVGHNVILNSYSNLPEELEIFWDNITGAEEYDLEWAFVDDYGTALSTFQSGIDINSKIVTFSGNSTRITTTSNYHKIPLVYEHGYLIYRVRAVGRSINNSDLTLEGTWSLPDNQTLSYYNSSSACVYNVINIHEADNKNWQYNATFAEEGKRKHTVTYADGSLRSRQIITQNNSDKTVIIGQTIYDYQGRKAIDILPVPDPESQNEFKYHSEFAKNTLGNSYSKADFDIDPLVPSGCSNGAPALNTTAGAGKYYSSNNLLTGQNSHRQYTPDAFGYAFVQTEYKSDNTGRIKNQGGVGDNHHIGSGHQTKYLFGSPDQEELDAMFGSEVGYFSHYQKNVVIDANGQASISYLDLKGKTIATALAGDSPVTMSSVSTSRPATFNAAYINDQSGLASINGNSSENNSLVFTKNIPIESSTNYTINYDISPTEFTTNCIIGGEICYDCVYELNISLKDECGFEQIPTTSNLTGYFAPTGVTGSNALVGDVNAITSNGSLHFVGFADNGCANNSTTYHPASIILSLNPGEYTLCKTLKVSSDAADFYLQQYLQSNCVKKISDFEAEAKAAIDTSGCNVPCLECLESATICEANYQALLSDVSFGGQYAGFEINNGGVTSSDAFSILNEFNSLPKISSDYLLQDQTVNAYKPYWRNPIINGHSRSYEYENGMIAYVPVNMNDTYYAGLANSKIFHLKIDLATGYLVPGGNITGVMIHDLKDLTAFKNAWNVNFARFLVEYHPEFSYYQFCITQSGISEHYFPKKVTSIPLGNATNYNNLSSYKSTFNSQWKGTKSFVSKNLHFNTPTAGNPLTTIINTNAVAQLSSEEFDEQLKTYVTSISDLNTFCNGNTTMVNSILNGLSANGTLDLINIDPYFENITTNPIIQNKMFGSATGAILEYYRQKLLSKMQFAPVTSVSGILINNIKQAFLLSVVDPQCNFQNVYYPSVTPPVACGNSITTDEIWNRYKEFYLSNKRQILFEMADEFGKIPEYGISSANDDFEINMAPANYSNANLSSTVYFQQLTKTGYPGSYSTLPNAANYRLIKGYNGCIGNPTFDPNTSDFVRYNGSPFGSNLNNPPSINYQYPGLFNQIMGFQSNYYNDFSQYRTMALPWNTSFNAAVSQGWGYFDRGQTCNSDLAASFQVKVKRFQSGLGYAEQKYGASSPEDLGNILGNQVSVQNQMLSGICPLANDFKALLNNMVHGIPNSASTSYSLTSNSPLWIFPGFTKLLYDNIINSTCSSNYVFLQTQIPTGTIGNVLNVNLGGNTNNAGYTTNTLFGSINASCLNCGTGNLFTLTKTSSAYTFDNITSVDKIMNIFGGNFSLQITYTLTSGSSYNSFTDIISGTTCLPLSGCASQPVPTVCEPNAFAKDFVKLLSALGSTYGSGASTLTDLFNTTGVNLNNSSTLSYGSYLTNNIYTKLGGANVSSNNWKWNCTSLTLGHFSFLSSTSSSGFNVNISGLSYSPGYNYSFSNLKTVAGVEKIDVTITNLSAPFTSVVNTFNITITDIVSNTTIPLLDCHSLLNPLCDKVENQNYDELKNFLAEILPLYPNSSSTQPYNYNITYLNSFTNSLKSQLPGGVNGKYYLSRGDNGMLNNNTWNYKIGMLKPGYNENCLDLSTNTSWSYSSEFAGEDPFECIDIVCEINLKAQTNDVDWENLLKHISPSSIMGTKTENTLCGAITYLVPLKEIPTYISTSIEITTCWNVEKCCTEPISSAPLLSNDDCWLKYNSFVSSLNAIEVSATNVVTNNAAPNVNTNSPYLNSDSYVSQVDYCRVQYYSDNLSDIYIQYYQLMVPKIAFINAASGGVWTNPLSDPTSKFFISLGEFSNIQNMNMLYAYIIYVGNYNPAKDPPLLSFSEFLQTNPMLGECSDNCQKALDIGQTPSEPVGWNKDCVQELESLAVQNASIQYQQYINLLSSDFRNAYVSACLLAKENLNTSYTSNRYHYTLYYYDQAGNLIKTVPPNGVALFTTPADLALVVNKRNAGAGVPKVPAHSFSTLYKYNSLNQLTEQTMPDHDYYISSFYYDKLGRLVVSQNPKQKHSSTINYIGLQQYSYTNYDVLGRIQEVGEVNSLPTNAPLTLGGINQITNDLAFTAWLGSSTKQQITTTSYDYATFASTNFQTDFLRGRVASTKIDVDGNGVFENASHYSYDVHGNVKSMINQYNYKLYENITNKRIDYDYDLISGKVNTVYYQRNFSDQYLHKYYYDADNRIVEVQTSKEGYIWNKDAKYYYYLHGPLARTELGDRKVQGLDYYYTIQGWIKGVNGESFMRKYDPGKDGFIESSASGPSYAYLSSTANIHKGIGIDALAYSLGYYEETGTVGTTNYKHKDYIPIKDAGMETLTTPYANTKNNFASLYTNSFNLYNGNIKHMSSVIVSDVVNKSNYYRKGDPAMQTFYYDQLNRIKASGASYNYNAYGQAPMNLGTSYENQYTNNNPLALMSKYKYDLNGNITKLDRSYITLGAPNAFVTTDAMLYNYKSNSALPGTNTTGYNSNKLDFVSETINAGVGDFQPGQRPGNYDYDDIGNLIKDDQEEIQNIKWNVYGKIESITRTASCLNKSDLEFRYDAKGDRIMKIDKKRIGGVLATNDQWKYTIYVRDAQGNVMSVYETNFNNPSLNNYEKETKLIESHLYGSSRLGIDDRSSENQNEIVPFTSSSPDFANGANITGYGNITLAVSPLPLCSRLLGNKTFELSNHLGNVMTTISDRKIAIDAGVPGTDFLSYSGTQDGKTDYYIADITSSTDYYPFGSPIPGRKFQSSSSYRYGFNGKENDKETVGTDGGSQDYGFRIYNPALAKFLSVDPLAAKYPFMSPYGFAENTPIWGSDLDGLELNINPYKITLLAANKLSNNLEQANTIAKVTNNYNAQVSIGVAKWAVNGLYSLAAMGGEMNPRPQHSACGGVAPYSKVEQEANKGKGSGEPFAGDVNKIVKGDISEKIVGAMNIGAAFTPFLQGESAIVSTTEESFTLYRGVNENHLGYSDALGGKANPIGGNASAAEHNFGNTNSPYTSWTSDYEVAKNYALRPDGTGVILQKEFSKSSLIKSPDINSVKLKQGGGYVGEKETLIKGKVSGATVKKP